MTVYRDAQLTLDVESTFNTPVTTARWLPYVGDPSMEYQPIDVDSEAIYPGPALIGSNRTRCADSASGSVEFEVLSKLFGKLLKACTGAGSSNLVSGTTYQQVFTLGSGVLDSLTMQFVRKLWGGTDAVDTYAGCTVSSFELSMDKTGILKLAVEIDGASYSTVIAKSAATVTYPNRFGWSGLTVKSGTLTEATTIALASATTNVDGVKSFSIKVDNGLTTDDFRANSAGKKSQQVPGRREITGSIEVDFTATTYRDAFKAGTGISLLFELSTGVALSTGTETFQIVLPLVMFNKDPRPNADGTAPTATLEFDVLKATTATNALALVVRTSDTAL